MLPRNVKKWPDDDDPINPLISPEHDVAERMALEQIQSDLDRIQVSQTAARISSSIVIPRRGDNDDSSSD